MDKRFWISGVVMSIAALMLGFVVHGLMLHDDYAALTNIMRSEAEQQNYFHYMLIAHLLIGFSMTWLYRQGVESGKGALGQGLRFGLAAALFAVIPIYMIYYAVQQLPEALVHKQIIFDTIAMLLLGVLVAYLNPRRAG
jgi:ABC-type Fe3+ transport system permease subunit